MKTVRFVTLAFLIAAMLLSGCTPPAAETPAATTAPTQVPPTAVPSTAVPPTEAPPSLVGGTLIWSIPGEPDTLDWQATALAASYWIDWYLCASLMVLDPSGMPIPYLAESYSISDDGLVYEFKLRQDVMFTNGDPLTAQSFVYSYNRALDPATASPVTATLLAGVTNIEAIDDYTLRLTLSQPNAPLLFNLADPGSMAPVSQASVESQGDQYGRNPAGVGPYMVKEWVTGDHVTLARNPDYNWGPEIAENKGPYNIEEIEFRIIPEYSTTLSGLQAGDITFAQMLPRDVQTFEDAGNFEIFGQLQKGLWPFFFLNISKPPFDNLQVRQAFNLAVDRQGMLDVLAQGDGVIMYGPLSPSQIGYWSGIEQIGYGFDLERAKTLIQEAGYTYDTAGMLLTPDGQPFALTLYTTPVDDTWVKVAEIAKEQYKALGVDITIEQYDPGVLAGMLFGGQYNIATFGVTAMEADILYLMYHSSQIGAGINVTNVNDPALDALLASTRTTTDTAARQEIINQVQQKVVEMALSIPLYDTKTYYILNDTVKGASMLRYDVLNLADAYIEP
jgi:peptide/nickel transport system substrate-binding protein